MGYLIVFNPSIVSKKKIESDWDYSRVVQKTCLKKTKENSKKTVLLTIGVCSISQDKGRETRA